MKKHHSEPKGTFNLLASGVHTWSDNLENNSPHTVILEKTIDEGWVNIREGQTGP